MLVSADTSELPLDKFALSYTMPGYSRPGTIIIDSTLPDATNQEVGVVQYRLPANLDQLDDVIATAAGKLRPKGIDWLVWFFASAILALFLYRRFRRQKARKLK